MAEDIDRTDADALFTEGMRLEIINQLTTKESVALQTIPTVQMSNKKDKVPVVSTLPTAGFLAAEGTAKPEDEVTWEGKYLQAEEIAVIIPIDDSVIADAQIDVASQVTKLVAQEFARVIDAAVFFGTGAPASWPTGGVFGAIDAANKIEYSGIEDYGQLFSAVEANGNDVTDLWASREVRADLRHPIIDGQAMQAPGLTIDNVYGVPLTFPLGWDKTKAKAIAADDECLLLGIRQDMTFDWSSQAYLEGFGSLWQKDATALRAVMRLGFVIAGNASIETGDNSVLPIAALTPAAP